MYRTTYVHSLAQYGSAHKRASALGLGSAQHGRNLRAAPLKTVEELLAWQPSSSLIEDAYPAAARSCPEVVPCGGHFQSSTILICLPFAALQRFPTNDSFLCQSQCLSSSQSLVGLKSVTQSCLCAYACFEETDVCTAMQGTVLPRSPRLLVCHDMAGGYGTDAAAAGLRRCVCAF